MLNDFVIGPVKEKVDQGGLRCQLNKEGVGLVSVSADKVAELDMTRWNRFIPTLNVTFDYLSLKKKVSPLICATASKTTGSVQMSIGVTGPWVGGKGLSVGIPV